MWSSRVFLETIVFPAINSRHIDVSLSADYDRPNRRWAITLVLDGKADIVYATHTDGYVDNPVAALNAAIAKLEGR